MAMPSDKAYGEHVVGLIAKKIGVPKEIAINQYEAVSPGVVERIGQAAKLLNDVDAINSAVENVTEGWMGPTVPGYQQVFNALKEEHTFWLYFKRTPPAILEDLKKGAEEAAQVVTKIGTQTIPWIIGGAALWIFLPRIIQGIAAGGVKGIKETIKK